MCSPRDVHITGSLFYKFNAPALISVDWVSFCINLITMCGSRGGGHWVRTPPPLKNHNFIGFPSNTGPDPLKISKLPSQHSTVGHYGPTSESQHSTVGHYGPTSETPFQWRFAGRSIMVFGALFPPKKQKKLLIRVGPPLTKLSESAHENHNNGAIYC